MRSGVIFWLCAAVSLVCIIVIDASAFGVGDTVRVITNTNVRTGARTNYREITDPDYSGTARPGTVGKITAGPQTANGYTWWRVDFGPGSYSGWAVQDGLQVTASSQPTKASGAGKNPLPDQVCPEILRLSEKYKIPAVIIMAVAYQENGWAHFKTSGDVEISGDGGIGMMQVTRSSATGKWPPIAEVIAGQQGSNSFTVVRCEDQRIDVVRLENEWQYNLQIGCQILLAKRIECKGQNDDASILENWYYPVAYYNGGPRRDQPWENDPASADFLRMVGTDSDRWKNKFIFPYQECVFNIVAQKCPLEPDIRACFGEPIVVTLPGPKTVERNGYTCVDQNFKGGDYITFLANGRAEVGKPQAEGVKSYPYANVPIHRVGFGSLEMQDAGSRSAQEPTSAPGVSSETGIGVTGILGKWSYANDTRLADIVTLQFEQDGTVLMVSPLGNVRTESSGCSSGKWQVEQGDRVIFHFTEMGDLRGSAQIEGDRLRDFKMGDLHPGVTLVRRATAQRIEAASKVTLWNEYVSDAPVLVSTMILRLRQDRSFLAIGSISHKWKMLSSGSVQVYMQGPTGDVIEHSKFRIQGDRLIDDVCGASYKRVSSSPR